MQRLYRIVKLRAEREMRSFFQNNWIRSNALCNLTLNF